MSHKKIFIFIPAGNEYFFVVNYIWPKNNKKYTHEKYISSNNFNTK